MKGTKGLIVGLWMSFWVWGGSIWWSYCSKAL